MSGEHRISTFSMLIAIAMVLNIFIVKFERFLMTESADGLLQDIKIKR